jgi:cardiolipin synthase A/B
VNDAPIPRTLRAWRAWGVARRLPDGVRDPAFRALVQRVDGGPVHRCPTVRLLPDGEEAFARMHEAMAAARDEILVETYILRDDRLGERVQEALVAASARGVHVCVLADAVGSFATRTQFWDTLERGGVELRHFHRVWQHPLEALRRDHRKLLVVDRAVAFTGGMNIGEEYGSSITQRHDAWRDTFIEVHGSVARELAAVFAEGWDRAGGPALPGLEYVSWSEGVVLPPSGITASAPFWWDSGRGTATSWPWQAPQRWQQRLQRQLQQRLGPGRDRRRGRRVRRVPDMASHDGPGVIVLDPRPGRGQREMLTVLAALVGAARERLWITTPYFAPPTRALRLLGAAAERGVDVRLLLPSERTDVAIARHAAHGAYHMLLARGVRVYEYQQATLHAKTLVVDGHVGMVGSSNLDFRSFWLNAECNVLVFDDHCAETLEHIFLRDLEGSEEILLEAWSCRPLGHRLLDRAARALRWAL